MYVHVESLIVCAPNQLVGALNFICSALMLVHMYCSLCRITHVCTCYDTKCTMYMCITCTCIVINLSLVMCACILAGVWGWYMWHCVCVFLCNCLVLSFKPLTELNNALKVLRVWRCLSVFMLDHCSLVLCCMSHTRPTCDTDLCAVCMCIACACIVLWLYLYMYVGVCIAVNVV